MAFRLLVARGLAEGQQFIAVQPEVLIGRATGNDVVLPDEGVAGMHARIVERSGRYVVEDLGTPSGTFLNGERLTGERELKSGDTIGLGAAVVQFGVELEGPVRKKLVPEGLLGASSKKKTGEVPALRLERDDDDTEATAPAGRKDEGSRRATDRETPAADANTAALSQAELDLALRREGAPRQKLRPGKPVNERTATTGEAGLRLEPGTDVSARALSPDALERGLPPFEPGTDVSGRALSPDELEQALPKLRPSLVPLPTLRGSGASLAPPVPDERTVVHPSAEHGPGADEPTQVRPSGPRASVVGADEPTQVRPSGPRPSVVGADEPTQVRPSGPRPSVVGADEPTHSRPSGRHPSLVDMTSDAVLIADAPEPPGFEAPTGRVQAAREPAGLRPSGPKAATAPAPVASASSAAPRAAKEVPEGSRVTVDAANDANAKAAASPEAITGPMDLKPIADVLVSAGDVLRQPPDLSRLSTDVRPRLMQAMLPTGDDEATMTREPDAQPESPAERARRRRAAQKSLRGQLGWLWTGLSAPARLAAAAAVTAAAAVIAAGAWQLTRGGPHRELPREPTTLSGAPVEYSFGLGAVDYERPDNKEFRFEVKAPTAAAVLVHYQAQDIGPSEVSVAVNGTELGFVPADVGLPDRDLELLVSRFVIKRNDTNLVVFDNVKNPPGHERWRVSKLWVELIPVPDTPRDQALQAAHAAYERGTAIEKQPGAGDEVLFKAWRAYREGWLALLSLPDEERGPLFNELKQHADGVRLKLDSECGALMLEAKKQMELGNPDAAREVLQEVLRNFPARDHPCPSLAEEKLGEYDL